MSDAGGADAKPDADGGADGAEGAAANGEGGSDGSKPEKKAIQIRVKDQAGEDTIFKIKTTTKMGKVFTAYAAKKNLELDAIRFILDGERIPADATPMSLDLQDDEQIDCVLEQVGGGRDAGTMMIR